MRNPVACVACRNAKQKCIHQDQPPCERCIQQGRAESCQFPPPGTSSIHRKPKRQRVDDGSASTFNGTTPPANILTPRSNDAVNLDDFDPFALLTDDVKNSYLRCSYKWSFHHTPSLLRRMRDRSLESWMAWAILALAIRFVRDAPPPFATVTEASNAFAAHARQQLQADIEHPSISRVQALLMLTGHDWGAGNGQRAWIYLGMAIRLVEIMGLCHEPKLPRNRRVTRDEFIEAEIGRRTAWTCFLMDSLLSGGRGRKRSLAPDDMAIQLPCEKEDFVFGEPVATPRLNGQPSLVPSLVPPQGQPVGQLGIIAYSMRVANVWGKVARWACSDEVAAEVPWSPTSSFQSLISELSQWKNQLPDRLQYDLFLLQSHNAVDQGQAYCYMHSIYFMSRMFLHRAYLPVLGPSASGHPDEAPRAYGEDSESWKSWKKSSRRELFREATMVLDMLDEMRTFGVYFLRGLVPWIGFTIYTAVGVMLYSSNFPSPEDDPSMVEKGRERVVRGCSFLEEMQSQWPMAVQWSETIKRMQAFYRSQIGVGTPVSHDERQSLRRAMVDYGALQPSPVHRHGGDAKHDGILHSNSHSHSHSHSHSLSLNSQGTSILNTTHHPTHAHISTHTHTHTPTQPTHPQSAPPPQTMSIMSPPASTPNGHMSGSASAWTPQNAHEVTVDHDTGGGVDDFLTFGFDIRGGEPMSNAELEDIMSATQEFWASFPGEVGVPGSY